MNKLFEFPDVWRDYSHFRSSFLNLHNSTNNTYGFQEIPQEHEENNLHAILSLSTGIFMIILINLKYSKTISCPTKHKELLIEPTCQKQLLVPTVCTFISVLISPLVFTTIVTFSIYRQIIEKVLRTKYGDRFHGILEGTDSVWAIEDVSKSVINVLALIEHKEGKDTLLNTMRNKINELFLNEDYKKLSCIREKEFGYYFWKESHIQINDHVREMIPIENTTKFTKDDMEKVLSFHANVDLPDNHKSTLEILVGTQPLMEENQPQTYPILFRIHHSVGDGIVLISILLNSIADKHCDFLLQRNNCNNIVYKNLPPSPEGSPTKIVKISYKNKTEKVKSTPNHLVQNAKYFGQSLLLGLYGPGCLMQQLLARKIDGSVLHGANLSGDKNVVWLVEEQPEFISIIRRTKGKFQNVSFSEVLLTAVSASFADYFEKHDIQVPDTITVVVPARIPETQHEKGLKSKLPKLQNRFSVAMLNLPVNVGCAQKTNLIQRLFAVKQETDLLRKSWDYQVNYWLLSVISKILPEPVLKPLVYSAQSTTVVSNVPGPHQITICDGNKLKNLVFWLPNRGLTGLGVSVLSYGGRLQLGLIADKALIPSAEGARAILQDTFKYLRDLERESSARTSCS